MGRCLGTASSSVSAVVRDNRAQGVTPRSPKAWEGRNQVNTYSNGASEKSIGIYAKSRCQWSGQLIHLEPNLQRYGRLKPQGASKGSSRVVELVCGLHHVNSGGDQGKFLSGGVSA